MGTGGGGSWADPGAADEESSDAGCDVSGAAAGEAGCEASDC